jgi:carbonic anhydrase/acetyltransferase-like protein (isoleucine patch superfamily)
VIGAGSLVGAGALFPGSTVIPPDHRASGVPAGSRNLAGTAIQIDYAVPLYVENARLYRDRLTRIG